MTCASWIRLRASLMAMRRTCWIDQRINDGVAVILCLPWFGVAFFFGGGGLPPSWRRRASPRNVAMPPPTPGYALVAIESELVFRGLETVLDRPPMAFDRHQRFDGCCRWTLCGEEGEITIGDMTMDQPTACSKTLICAVFDLLQ